MKHRSSKRYRRGGAIVLLILLLPLVLAIASYCINIAYAELVRTELQTATDLAARAAGRTLTVTGDIKKATSVAERLLAENKVGGKILSTADAGIDFGVSTRLSADERYAYRSANNPNAVRVISDGESLQLAPLFPTFGVPIKLRPIKSAISTLSELEIVLVLDRSGSMAFADNEVAGNVPPASAPDGWKFGDAVPPDARWRDLVYSVGKFIELLEKSSHDERVALCTYSDTSKTDVNLTNDYSAVRNGLRSHTDRFNGGSTNIGAGILQGADSLSKKRFARPWATRVMIVLSDGIHNTGTEPISAAKLAAREEIMIFTVTFSAEADMKTMSAIASEGSGKHFHATNGNELAQAFEDIAKSLPNLITY